MISTSPPVIIFDLDGTITRYDTYVRFLLYVISRRPHKSMRLPILAFDVIRHKLGNQSNTWLKKRFLAALLSGHDRDTIESWANSFSEQVIENGVYQDALEKIKFHRNKGHELVLLSARLDIYVKPLGTLLEIDHIICTKTSWNENILDRGLDGDNCYGRVKIERLQSIFDHLGAGVPHVAYADHESDFPLLKLATKGYVVNPDNTLKYKALNNGLDSLVWM